MMVVHSTEEHVLLQIQYVGSFRVESMTVRRKHAEGPVSYEFAFSNPYELVDNWTEAVAHPLFAILTHKDGSTIQFEQIYVAELDVFYNTIRLLCSGSITIDIKG
jgi:hypothetical protein